MADAVNPMPGMEVEIRVQGMQASRFEAIEAAEAARSTAETERENAESARAGAEQARVNAESARNAAESGRKAADEVREQNEAARAEADGGRATAESARAEAENLRTLAETGRAASEAARAAAESARASAEQVRAEAEAARDVAESERASAETARAEAESGRAAAEALRAETFAGYESRLDTKLDNTPDTWPKWTADAQAAARARMGIPGGYELIEEITLEEDVSVITRKTYPDGKPYNLEKIIITAEIETCESKLNGQIDNGSNVLGSFTIDAGAKGFFKFYGDLLNSDLSLVDTKITAASGHGSNTVVINTTPRLVTPATKLNRINIKANDGVFTSGSVIKLYGVKLP